MPALRADPQIPQSPSSLWREAGRQHILGSGSFEASFQGSIGFMGLVKEFNLSYHNKDLYKIIWFPYYYGNLT